MLLIQLRRHWPLAVVVAAGALLYGDVVRQLAAVWSSDDNYGHGFLVLPLAAYFAYERRHRLGCLPLTPNRVAGLAVVAGSLLLLAAGRLGAEFFLTRVSLVGALAGSILFLAGAGHLRQLSTLR